MPPLTSYCYAITVKEGMGVLAEELSLKRDELGEGYGGTCGRVELGLKLGMELGGMRVLTEGLGLKLGMELGEG